MAGLRTLDPPIVVRIHSRESAHSQHHRSGTMPPRRPTYRRMSESVRHRLDVATAMAWEALADAHVAQALEFISLFEDRLPLEEALTRYLQEMDMGETMASTVRTKVLVTLEDEGKTPEAPLPMLTSDNGAQDVAPPEDDEGWRRFRPDTVMRGVFERQRRREEVERLI